MSKHKTKYSTNWKEHYLIFYKINSDKTFTALAKPKPIVACSNKHNELFYGVKSTRYGMRPPAQSEYWGIFSVINGEWVLHLGNTIPLEYSRQIMPLNDGRFVYCKKSKTNITFSISTNNKKAKVAK